MKKLKANENILLNTSDHTSTKKFISFTQIKRHNYKVGWIIIPLILFGLTLISIARFTIVGAIIDDLISFPFGIGKYLVYLLLLFLCFTIFFGYRVHFSLKAKLSLILLFIITLWILSSAMTLFYAIKNNNSLWKNDYYKTLFSDYFNLWYQNSLFSIKTNLSDLFIGWQDEFWYLGGGLIGISVTAVVSFISLPADLILAIVCFFINVLWIFNINPFKRKHKKLKQEKPIEIEEPLEEVKKPEITEEDKHIFAHHSKLKNRKIIDDFIILDISDDLLKNEKNININPTPRTSKNPKSVIEEIMDADEHSSYSEQEFNLDNDEDDTSHIFDDDSESEIVNGEMNSEENLNNVNDDFNNEEEYKYNDSSNDNINEDYNSVLDDDFNADENYDDNYDEKDNSESYSQETSYEYNDEVAAEESIDDDNYDEEDELYEDNDDEKPSLQQMNNFIIDDLYLKQSKKNYFLPKINLLNNNSIDRKSNKINWTYANILAKKIMTVFNQFNVFASIQSINVGPQVTKFEIAPDPGTKVRKIVSLEYDLKLALATNSLRIETPIQGKPFIGLEIPNKNIETISFASMIENIPLKYTNEKLLVGIGKTVENEFLYLKINELPHLLISGTTGSGKSVSIKSIISSLIMHSSPSELKLVLIDLKRVELKIFSELPHLLCPIIYNYQKAINILKFLTKEMEWRYDFFSKHNVNNIDAYNMLNKEHKLPKIVIVIDELADLMLVSKNEVEESITRLSQMARASGIHLIIATQRPSTDIITGIIKTNIPSRISFYLSSAIDSRTILNSSGAEKLINKGDMLYKGLGRNNLIRLQGIYISDEEIHRLVQWWKKQELVDFNKNILSIIDGQDMDNENNYINSNDPLYDEVKAFVLKNQKASVSLLQRYFSIGYIRASKIIDRLEYEEIIGPQNGSKPRAIYEKENNIN